MPNAELLARPRSFVARAHHPAPDTDWDNFVGEVRRRAGIDFRHYKQSQLQRRVRGLLQRSGVDRFDDYLRLLEREPARRGELQRCVTVTVSEFFRSPDQFDYLGRHVLPRLIATQPELHVWSAGCSYGAEPYSVALLLQQLAPLAEHHILATDVDELALVRAAAADSFSERDLRNVPPELLCYFGPGAQRGRFALSRELARRVTFRKHDLLLDPPRGTFDLILCRNVMIYFTDEAKRRVYNVLHEALRPGGYLFIGDAEVLNRLPDAGFVQEAVGFYRR